MQFNIAVIAGDGIGPEIMAPTLELLSQLAGPSVHLNFQNLPTAADFDFSTQDALLLGSADALQILPDPVSSGASLSPLSVVPDGTVPLLAPVDGEIWLLTDAGPATVKTAIDLAQRRKSCGLGAGTVTMLEELITEAELTALAGKHPDIRLEKMPLKDWERRVSQSPGRFDVVATSAALSDVTADIPLAQQSRLPLAALARPDTYVPLFYPRHGHMPDVAGRGIANPLGLIRAAALMVQFLALSGATPHLAQSGKRINAALSHLLDRGAPLPRAMGGSAGTLAVVAAVYESLGGS